MLSNNELLNARTEIVKKLDAQTTSEYTVQERGSSFNDSEFIANTPITFENNPQYQDTVDMLNAIISVNNLNTSWLCVVRLFANDDDENIKLYVKYLYDYGNAMGVLKFTEALECKVENAKDVFAYVYQYYKENPILFVMEFLNYHRSSTEYKQLKTDPYFKAAITKAISDFAELKLIVQACNI